MKTNGDKTDNHGKNIIDIIALNQLGIETLEERHSDSLDFHDCGVLSIKNALEMAFKAGIEVGLSLNKGELR